MRGLSSWRAREARSGLLLVAPGLLLLSLFLALPVVASLLLSLTDFDLYAVGDPSNARIVGLRNYARLLHDPVFWKALGNTFFFVVVGGPLTVSLALGTALLLNHKLVRFPGLFRTIYFAPVVTTLVAVAAVWKYLYHPRFGLLNAALGLVGLPAIDWLGDPHWAMPAIVLMAAWKNFGASMIIFVAGLKAIPESLYEAARLDGAGPWQRFRRITVPLLAPTFLFVGLTTTIGYFQLFAEPYVMSGGDGGPMNATLSVALFMYKQGFRWWSIGSSAAIAFVLFAVILGATLLQRRLQKGGEA
ncbi:MAG TPA: sugar ABC transporter permease [Thermoanaerobaculia bacterium]|nr:sugar ABC transporter permease [Thermoanaerobaculia bacterium]